MQPSITLRAAYALCRDVKRDIDDNCRAHEDDERPGILLTVGDDGSTWSYQTGDTSYHGGAYSYRAWGQAAIYRNTNCKEAAQTILDELAEALSTEDAS